MKINVMYVSVSLAIKRNEVLIDDPTWMTLDYNILSERRQTHKSHILDDSSYMKYPE